MDLDESFEGLLDLYYIELLFKMFLNREDGIVRHVLKA